MKRRLLFILSAIFLFSFALLSKFEDRSFIRTLDFAATVKIQDRIDKSAHLRLAALVDNTMEGATFFAGPEFTSIVVLILTGIAFRKKRWWALFIPAAFIACADRNVWKIHRPSPVAAIFDD